MSPAKRKRASDNYDAARTPLIGGERVSFEKAYPAVERAVLTLDQTGDGVSESIEHQAFSPPPPTIDCPNPLCLNGGIELQSSLGPRIRARATKWEWSTFCRGYESHPQRV